MIRTTFVKIAALMNQAFAVFSDQLAGFDKVETRQLVLEGQLAALFGGRHARASILVQSVPALLMSKMIDFFTKSATNGSGPLPSER